MTRVDNLFEAVFIIGLCIMTLSTVYNSILQWFLREYTEQTMAEKNDTGRKSKAKQLMLTSFIIEWTTRFLVLGLTLWEILLLFSPAGNTCTTVDPAPLAPQRAWLLSMIPLQLVYVILFSIFSINVVDKWGCELAYPWEDFVASEQDNNDDFVAGKYDDLHLVDPTTQEKIKHRPRKTMQPQSNTKNVLN